MPRTKPVEVHTVNWMMFAANARVWRSSPASTSPGSTDDPASPIPITFLYQDGHPRQRDAALSQVFEQINWIFALANLHRDDPSPEARELHRVLTLISKVRKDKKRAYHFTLRGVWPPPAVLAVRNLIAIVRNGRSHVRWCPKCRYWFRAMHGLQRTCYRCSSQNATAHAAKRQENRRKKVNEEDRLLREGVKGTVRTK